MTSTFSVSTSLIYTCTHTANFNADDNCEKCAAKEEIARTLPELTSTVGRAKEGERILSVKSREQQGNQDQPTVGRVVLVLVCVCDRANC